ncbi:MAG: UbiA family prenyltransferase [Chlamydiia bacterium]|nr:UbiA family prenyltransferase [Chlamydiia bacterium]
MTAISTRSSLFSALVVPVNTLFSLPWALTSYVIASQTSSLELGQLLYRLSLFLFALFSLRIVAMLSNHLLYRHEDRANPRTQKRPLPVSAIRPSQLALWIACASLSFLALCALLGPPLLSWGVLLLAWTLLYPLAKHHTWAYPFILSFVLFMAPIVAWQVTGAPWTAFPLFLALASFTLTAGADSVYSILDLQFDRSYGIQSIPRRFGIPKTLLIARVLHSIALICLFLIAFTMPYPSLCISAVVLMAVRLFWLHFQLDTDRESSIMAFMRRSPAEMGIALLILQLVWLI